MVEGVRARRGGRRLGVLLLVFVPLVGTGALVVSPSAPASGSAATAVVSVGDVSVVESQTALVTAKLDIGLTAPLATAECIWFHTVKGTALGAPTLTKHDGTQDFLATTGSVLLAAGTTVGSISTTVNYDTVAESAETYTVVVTKATAASGNTCTSSDPQDANAALGRKVGAVHIVDNSGTARKLRVGGSSVIEGNTTTTPAPVSFGFSVAPTTAECIWYHTLKATATGAPSITKHDGTQDFVSKNTFVKVASGTSTGTIGTTVNYDTVPEGTETYSVTVTKTTVPASNGTCSSSAAQDPKVSIATGSAIVSIVDDDAATLALLGGTVPVCALPLDPNWRTSTNANYVCNVGNPPDAGDQLSAVARDPYGYTLGDVTTSTAFAGSCRTNTSACAIDEPYGTTAQSVQATDGAATGGTTITVQPESWSCRGANYDVNQDDTDGCETAGSVAGTTAGTASSLGDVSCNDQSGTTFTTDSLGANYEVMASDQGCTRIPRSSASTRLRGARRRGSRSMPRVAPSARTTSTSRSR